MKRVLKIFSTLSLLLLLTGCYEDVTIGAFEQLDKSAQKRNTVNTAWKEVGFDQKDLDDFEKKLLSFKKCNDLIKTTEAYKYFLIKSPEIKNYNHYSDQTFVNQADKMSVAWYGIELDKCFDHIRGINYSSSIVQELSMIPKRRVIQILFALASLDNKEITWGQFNRRIENINNQARVKSEEFYIKLDNKTDQVINRVAILNEMQAIRNNRAYLRQELENSRYEIDQLRGEAKRLEEEKRMLETQRRQLELCAENPGAYYNCP